MGHIYRRKSISSSDIDTWSEDDLFQYIEKHNINADSVESVGELRQLVISHYGKIPDDVSSDAIPEDDVMQSSQRMIADILQNDKVKKRDLIEMYQSIKCFIRKHGTKTYLTHVYPNLTEELDEFIDDLLDQEVIIAVAGEVSSGKSSLFNLLIGEDIFPTAHLACSSTISRLHNSERRALEVTFYHHAPETFENIQDVRELQGHIRKYATHGRERVARPCKQVDIFWPVPILPENILLVDVPGVGESEEMDRMAIEYLNKALVCIYVLFSANSGGVQTDKLQMIIRERFRATKAFMRQDVFANTLFVCNYWDVVENSGHEKEVWNDTIKKLKSLIQHLDEDKVVKMSIKEASRHMDLGIGKTAKFETLTCQFKSLLREALSAKTNKHYRIQQNLTRNIEGYLARRRHLATLTRQEKHRKMEETQLELDYIIKESDEVTRIIKDFAYQRLSVIAQKLHSHIHETDTKERFLNCKDEGDPDASLKKDSRLLEYLISQRVKCKLQTLICDWEKEHHLFADLQKDVKVQVEEFLSTIANRLRTIDLDLTRGSDEKLSNLATIPDIPSAMGSSAPLWISISITLTMPENKRIFVCDRYSNNGFQHRMYNHIKSILEKALTEERLGSYLVETYLESLSEQVEHVVIQNAREEAATRRRELAIIGRDYRSTEQLLGDISKAKPELDLLIGCFRSYELVYVSDDHIDDTRVQIGEYIGGGQFSVVYRATVNTGQVAVKVLKCQVRPKNIYEQLRELQTFRALKHDNIVGYVGVHLYKREGDDETPSQDVPHAWVSIYGSRFAYVLQLCDESLEDKVFRKYKLQDRLNSGSRDEALTFFNGMIEGICAALVYMHGLNYMHRDLKVSNVLLKDGVPKLTDFGRTRLQAFNQGTLAERPTHMSPEMLSKKDYSSPTDIYSLGILMWEMWYGRHAYTEEAYQIMDLQTFVEMVVDGQRPSLEDGVQMSSTLQCHVSKCWDGDPNERLKADELRWVISDELMQLMKVEVCRSQYD